MPDEILDITLDIILGWNRNNLLEKFFDLETIIKNNAVENYLGSDFGTELREYIYVNSCRKLRKENEESLDEKDLVIILRYILKIFGYKVLSRRKYVNQVYQYQYKICL